MTRSNPNAERLYRLLSDLSPDLLADALPEAGIPSPVPPLYSPKRHIRHLVRAALIYAACAVFLIGLTVYFPALVDWLGKPTSPATVITTLPHSPDPPPITTVPSPDTSPDTSPDEPSVPVIEEWDSSALTEAPAYSTADCIIGALTIHPIFTQSDETYMLELAYSFDCGACTAHQEHAYPISDFYQELQVYLDGKWYLVPSLHTFPQEWLTRLTLEEGQYKRHASLDNDTYGILPAGDYRIAKIFYVDDKETAVYATFKLLSPTGEAEEEPILTPSNATKDMDFVRNSDGTYTVYGGTCTDTNVIFPSHCNGTPVTVIGKSVGGPWYVYVRSVIIPDTVTRILGGAFMAHTALTSIVIPDSVTYIGRNAFFGCYSMTEIQLSQNLTYIAPNAFHTCQGLREIILPDSLTHIGEGAFDNCSKLTQIVIPASVQTIEPDAFRGCWALEKVVFEDPHVWLADGVPIDLTSPKGNANQFIDSSPTLTKQ